MTQILHELYGLTCDAVPVRYSDKGLYFWEAGCSYYDEEKSVIQLRSIFQHKERYLGIYHKDEILAHEYVHVARFALHSEKYEEFFAYYISHAFGNHFRAYFGPLLTAPKEAVLFLSSFCMPLFALAFDLSQVVFTLPLFVSSYFLIRLMRRWRIWHRVRKEVGLKAMIRFTDEEIENRAKRKTG